MRKFNRTRIAQMIVQYLEPREQLQMQAVCERWYDEVVPRAMHSVTSNLLRAKIVRMLLTRPDVLFNQEVRKMHIKMGPFSLHYVRSKAACDASLSFDESRTEYREFWHEGKYHQGQKRVNKHYRGRVYSAAVGFTDMEARERQ